MKSQKKKKIKIGLGLTHYPDGASILNLCLLNFLYCYWKGLTLSRMVLLADLSLFRTFTITRILYILWPGSSNKLKYTSHCTIQFNSCEILHCIYASFPDNVL